MYKKTPFKIRPFEEIAEDISMARDIFPGCQTIFIGDSDNLLHKEFEKIVKLISKTFPHNRRITTYARSLTLARKKLEHLKKIKKAGLTRVHVGLESGSKTILKDIQKGVTPETTILGGLRAKEAGFELCFYVLCGIGGEGAWKEHAHETAKVINAVNPDFIRLRTLSLVGNAPLYNEWQEGNFKTIKPLTRLKEIRRLIELLEVKGCQLASDHVTNYLWCSDGIIFHGVDGELSLDKETMLTVLDKAIEAVAKRDDVIDANSMVQQGLLQRL
jgi:radical SAM superfamily enzyme YgiQ (UPF0313 family)